MVNTMKSMYIPDVEVGKHCMEQPKKKTVTLFGKPAQVYDDDWRTHLHLIVTHKCNAKCSFCIEKDSCRKDENSVRFLSQTMDLCQEMHREGILKTISITGGEPFLWTPLGFLVEEIRKRYPHVFLTVNTNGTLLEERTHILKHFDFINISRHYTGKYGNDGVFGISTPWPSEIMRLRLANTLKVRLQAVVNEDTKLDDYLDQAHLGVVDDLSFRMKMITRGERDKDNIALYRALVREAAERGTLVEQEIQDYYVYETHNVEGIDCTFSYSNMLEATRGDVEEAPNFHREFIIRPNGVISSSWDKGLKIIKE